MPNAAELFAKELLPKISADNLYLRLLIETSAEFSGFNSRHLNFLLNYPDPAILIGLSYRYDKHFGSLNDASLILKALEKKDLNSIMEHLKRAHLVKEKERIIRSIFALILTYRNSKTMSKLLLTFLIELITDCSVELELRKKTAFLISELLACPEMFPSEVGYSSIIGSPLPSEIIFDAVSALTMLLRDDNPSMRLLAIIALCLRKDEHVIKSSTELLYDGDPKVKKTAIGIISRYGRYSRCDAVESLIDLINDKDAEIRERSVFFLGETGDFRAVDPLINVIENDLNSEVQCEAIRALGQIDAQKAIDFLLKQFKNYEQTDRIKIAAAHALAKRGNQEAIEFLKSKFFNASINSFWAINDVLTSLLSDSELATYAIKLLSLSSIKNPSFIRRAIRKLSGKYRDLVEEALSNAFKSGTIDNKELDLILGGNIRNPYAYAQYLLRKKDKHFSYISCLSMDDAAKVPECCKAGLKVEDEAIAILNQNNEKESIHSLSCPIVKAAYWS